MNAVLQAMKERRSVRAYQDKPVPRDAIERICEAVTNRQLRDRLSAMNARIMGRDADPFYGAPVVLVVLADKSRGTYLYDGSLVMANLMLAAHAEGLGSCWIHRAREEFDSPEGKELLRTLGIKGDYEGIGNLIVGYPDGEIPEAKPRREGRVFYAK